MAEDRFEEDEGASAVELNDLWMKALKLFVVVTGVVLLIGTAAFVYLFLSKRESDRAAAEMRQHGPAAAIEAPDGARIREVQLENGRALVVLDGAGGEEYLLYVDLDAGERIGLVVLD